MLKKFFELLSSFFSSLFGRKKTQPPATPKPRPVSDHDKKPELVEDSSDVPRDTIITVVETDVEILPASGASTSGPFADEDKEDAFDDTSGEKPPTPKPQPQPGGESSSDSDKPSTPATDTAKPAEPSTPPKPTHKPRYIWCLDNGHGKLQPGKRSPVYEDDNGKDVQFLEYEFNRDIVERIMKALDKKGVKYFDIVPDFLEVGSFLEERVDRANKKKSDLDKIYISVHSNAGPTASSDDWVSSSVKGIETWYAQNSKRGQKIAAVFQKHLIEKTGFKNRNLKSTAEKPLYVLEKTTMPAILTENGFYNNKDEVKELMKDAVRQKIADAHIDAILEIEKNGIR